MADRRASLTTQGQIRPYPSTRCHIETAVANSLKVLDPERPIREADIGLDRRQFAPHIPVFDKSKRDDGTFSRGDFRYDRLTDVYHCPGGKRLGRAAPCTRARRFYIAPASSTATFAHLNRGAAQKNHRARYHATFMSMPGTLPVRLRTLKPLNSQRRARKKIEMRFAHLKRILRLVRLRLRGPRAPRMSLFWLLSLRTCAGSHRWLPDRHPLTLRALRSVRVA